MALTFLMTVYNRIILIVNVKIPLTCSKSKEIAIITLPRSPISDRPHDFQGGKRDHT